MKTQLAIAISFLILGACAHQPKITQTSNGVPTNINRTPAQDNTDTEITHMSRGYIGFFEEVQLDGSGDFSTTFRILDLKNDQYVFDKTILTRYDESTPQETSAVMAQQRADLLLIAASKIKSTHLKPAKPMPIQNFSTLGNSDGQFANEGLTYKGAFVIKGKAYGFEILEATATPAQIGSSLSWCSTSGYVPKLYSMSINQKLVHKDSRLPRSRGCAFGYGLDKVYEIDGKPLLFIRYKTVGFEGPDFRTITLPLN